MSIGGERKFTGILHDLTARVEMEGRLREQSALVRLGEMAAVIAHEVKNPLAAIRGAIQVIGGRLPAGSREAAVMTDIIARVDALNNWVRDLLLFARPPQARPTVIDVSAVLVATAALLREDAAYGELRVDISGEAPPVMADPELLKIVFLNLFLNSAMRGRGSSYVSVTSADNASDCRRRCRSRIPPESATSSSPHSSPEIAERGSVFRRSASRGAHLDESMSRARRGRHDDDRCAAVAPRREQVAIPLLPSSPELARLSSLI